MKHQLHVTATAWGIAPCYSVFSASLRRLSKCQMLYHKLSPPCFPSYWKDAGTRLLVNTANVLIAGVHGPLTQAFVRLNYLPRTRVTGSLLLRLGLSSPSLSNRMKGQQANRSSFSFRSCHLASINIHLSGKTLMCILIDIYQCLLNGEEMRK